MVELEGRDFPYALGVFPLRVYKGLVCKLGTRQAVLRSALLLANVF